VTRTSEREKETRQTMLYELCNAICFRNKKIISAPHQTAKLGSNLHAMTLPHAQSHRKVRGSRDRSFGSFQVTPMYGYFNRSHLQTRAGARLLTNFINSRSRMDRS